MNLDNLIIDCPEPNVSWHLNLDESPLINERLNDEVEVSVGESDEPAASQTPRTSQTSRSCLGSGTKWESVAEFTNKFDLLDFLYGYSHKMTTSHGNQTSKCNLNCGRHSQVYGYYTCTSTKCIKAADDKCSFRFRKNECLRDSTIHLYSIGEHADRYEGETDSSIRPGIHYFYKTEINKLWSDESMKTPYAVIKVLTKRLHDGQYDDSIPLPTLPQIRNYRRRAIITPTDGNVEFDQVTKLIDDLSYERGLDDKKAFSYGTKIGVGSDSDPFIVCFTSKHLLKNMSKYSEHYSVFHIDGTYKLVKNRFPVIAYGRSDTNGQLHLISVAICSHETTETYTHFYNETMKFKFDKYKSIVLTKWRSYPELADFVIYFIPQWMEGAFTNWHIFKSPPGFANTNNPMESFNKIIKARFTNFEEMPLIAFIMVIIEHLIPFYSENSKEFLFYRIPHKKTVAIAHKLDELKYEMSGFIECSYKGRVHTHTINFDLKSCTCRWFWSFAVCAHLVAACDLYNRDLKGYTKPKRFVYRPKRGRKAKALTFTELAFQNIPMPVIPLPIITEDRRPDLFLKSGNNMPGLPSLSLNVEPVVIVDEPETVVVRVTRSYNRTKPNPVKPVKEKIKRLQKKQVVTPATVTSPVQKKNGRGRPRKNLSALSSD